MIEVTTHLGVLYVDLHIPAPQSLKEKRMVLKKLKEKIRSNFNVSVAELDGMDKWQIATFGISMIGTDNRYMDSAFHKILSLIESYHAATISDHQIEFY